MAAPDPKDVLAQLQPLWYPLHKAFELGTEEARQFFSQRHKTPQPWLYPNIVRWVVLETLKAEGFDAEVSDGAGVEIEGLANHGIVIHHAGYTLRVMKALPDGRVPGPGASMTKQLFFHQLTLGPDFVSAENVRNLLLLWEPDADFNLGFLSLACPKGGHGAKAELDWHVPIPHPVETMAAAPPSLTAVAEDLEISLDQDAAASASEDE